jgi:hypothetical protein
MARGGAGTAQQRWEAAARLGTTGEVGRGRRWEAMVGLGRRGQRGLEGASEGVGGSRRERAPSVLPRGGSSRRRRRWRGRPRADWREGRRWS